jgi:short-subunit dehydrogenase
MAEPPSSGTKGRSGARRLALITGASAGLGEAFARAYSARGLDVALVARRAERLQALAAELTAAHGIEALAIPADLSLFEAQAPVMAALASRGREVDVLVNNAGFGIAQSFTGAPWARQRDFLMTMVVTPCALAYAVIPGMVARGGGSIVNMASLAAFSPGVAGNSLYPGAKSLLVKFSQALEAEYGDKGIKVTAVCPGFVRTDFAKAAGTHEIMQAENRRLWQTAEQVAEATIRANEAGKLVLVPGWHNKLAAALMKTLPEPLVRALIAAGSAKYHLEDQAG